ncbi:glycosyltransferase [Algoriphagus yeomjeoni]|uniref:glycosyltransferase n=1 Tax=Algoriphagus yeomjeoni TaxID=291403 RepID=UPI003CE48017
MDNQKLGVFLTTYERKDHLDKWVEILNKQTIKPNKVLIIDNSISDSVQDFFKESSFCYHRVGFNSGPAGAALIGLQALYKEGYDWIYWGDDDDPPTDLKTFERLLEIANQFPDVGIVGKVGGKFNPNTGRTRVLSNSELMHVAEADYVPGNKHILVSSRVIQNGILPDPKLFFGFEELEFCLRVKDLGFSILIDGQGMMEARKEAGNLGEKYRWKGKSIGDPTRVNRQYYSLRNMLYILWSRNHYLGYLFFLSKSLIKIPFSVRYGLIYFLKFSKLTLTAIAHQWIGRYGQYISTR